MTPVLVFGKHGPGVLHVPWPIQRYTKILRAKPRANWFERSDRVETEERVFRLEIYAQVGTWDEIVHHPFAAWGFTPEVNHRGQWGLRIPVLVEQP